MKFYIILAVLFIILIVLLVLFFIRDKKYLSKKTSEVMSDEVSFEIEQERETLIRKKEKFKRALEQAKKK